MKAEYDFSKAKKNPYAKRLKRRVTIRLINLYLRDCAESRKELNLEWRPEKAGAR